MPDIDPIFQKHIEKMKILHEDLKADIEKVLGALNLDEILRHPEGELQTFSEGLAEAMLKKYTTKFISEGVRFADEMKGLKRKIKVVDGKPTEGVTADDPT